MKMLWKVFFLTFLLVCLGTLTLLSADAAVGTTAELQAAINAANNKTASSTATTVKLTGNISVAANGTISVAGKHVVIDGQGKYSITRSSVTTQTFLFNMTNGADLTFQNITVNNHIFTVHLSSTGNHNLVIGDNATFTATLPTGHTDSLSPVLFMCEAKTNVITVNPTAVVQYKNNTINSRSLIFELMGSIHVYGTLYDDVPGPSSNHRLIYAKDSDAQYCTIYEGASLTMKNTGGYNTGTALIWAGFQLLHIKGGTFTIDGWHKDTATAELPHGMISLGGGQDSHTVIDGGTFVMGDSTTTGTAVAPLILAHNTGTLIINGGSFTQNYKNPLIRVAGVAVTSVEINGGTFTQNASIALSEINLATSFTVKGDSTKLTSVNTVIETNGSAPRISIGGNAVLDSGSWCVNFKGGKPNLTVSGGSIKGTYCVVYNNRKGYNPSADGFATVTVTGGTFTPTSNGAFYFNNRNDAGLGLSTGRNTLNISGGTYYAANSILIYAWEGALCDIVITGGNFKNSQMNHLISSSDDGTSPASKSITVSITGGTYEGADNAFIMMQGSAVLTSCLIKDITVPLAAGAKFVHTRGKAISNVVVEDCTVSAQGKCNMFWFESTSAEKSTVTVKGNTVLTHTFVPTITGEGRECIDSKFDGKIFMVSSGAVDITVTENALLSTKNDVIGTKGATVNVTLSGNAKLYAKHDRGWVCIFEDGFCSLTIEGNVHLRGGMYDDAGNPIRPDSGSLDSYAVRYFNCFEETDPTAPTSKFVLNISGTPTLEAQSSILYHESKYSTVASEYSITGGTFIGHYHYGFNMKQGPIDFKVLQNADFDTYNCCLNFESITFTNANGVFNISDCAFITHREETGTAGSSIRIGHSSHVVGGLTSMTLTNCRLTTNTEYAFYVGGSANAVRDAFQTVEFVYNDGQDHTFSGIYNCYFNNTTTGKKATAFLFTINSAGNYVFDGFTLCGNAVDHHVVTVNSAVSITVKDSHIEAEGLGDDTAVFYFTANANSDIVFCGDTVINTTGGNALQSYNATVNVTVCENAALTSSYQTFIFRGAYPVVNVEGGSITGKFCLVFYSTDRDVDTHGIYNISGGTLRATSGGVFYFHNALSNNAGISQLNITGGTVIASNQKPIYVWSYAKAKINIDGGTFQNDAGKQMNYFIATDGDARGAEVDLHITDGTFEGVPKLAWIYMNVNSTLKGCIIENVTLSLASTVTVKEEQVEGADGTTTTQEVTTITYAGFLVADSTDFSTEIVLNNVVINATLADIFTVSGNQRITLEATDSTFNTVDNHSGDSTLYTERAGRAFVVKDTAVLLVTLKNCNYNGVYSLFYTTSTAEEASKLTINGGTYTMDNAGYDRPPDQVDDCFTTYHLFQNLISCVQGKVLEVVLQDATFKNDKGTVLCGRGLGSDRAGVEMRITVRNCTAIDTHEVIETTGSPTVYFDVYGGTYTTTGNTVYIGAGTVFVCNIYGGTFVSTGGRAIQAGAMTTFGGGNEGEGENVQPVLNIFGGIFQSSGAGVLHLGNNAYGYLVTNIYGGYFGGGTSYLIKVIYNATLNIYAGTFHHTGSSNASVWAGEYELIATKGANSAQGFINVYGGAFRAPNNTKPLFVVETAESVLNLQSCVAMSNGNFVTYYRNSEKSLNHTGTGMYTAHNALDLQNGVQLRLVKNGQGLRFVTNISKATYDHYESLAVTGTTVTYGTLIFPAQYMQWLDQYTGEYTQEALERLGLQFLRIVATEDGFKQNADGSYTMKAAVAGILEENIEMEYTALSYVMYYVANPNGGDPIRIYQYSNHDFDKHERSMYQVTRAAANDISATEQGIYTNQLDSTVTGNGNSAYVGAWSPYSAEQWTLMEKYWKWNDTTKSEVKTIDLYLIAGQSNAAGYSTVTDAFKNAHKNDSFPYIYYAGGMPLVYTRTFASGVTSVSKSGASRLVSAASMINATLGQGSSLSSDIGAEFGMATILKNTYNESSGKYASIVKYAMGSITLSDDLSSGNERCGNWASPSYLEAKIAAGGSNHNRESGNAYNNFIFQVKSAVEDYRAMGFIVSIKGVFWMQGEDDRSPQHYPNILEDVNTLGSYRNMFRYLVNDMRADFRGMTPYNTDLVEVYVGEISKECGVNPSKTAEEIAAVRSINANFIAMQQTLDEIADLDGIYIIGSSKYTVFRNSTDYYHWIVDDMFTIGKMVGESMAAHSVN